MEAKQDQIRLLDVKRGIEGFSEMLGKGYQFPLGDLTLSCG